MIEKVAIIFVLKAACFFLYLSDTLVYLYVSFITFLAIIIFHASKCSLSICLTVQMV